MIFKRLNKPRTIADKLQIYDGDIAPELAKKIIYEVTEADLVRLVTIKGKTAKAAALAAPELQAYAQFFASHHAEDGLRALPERAGGEPRFDIAQSEARASAELRRAG